MFMLDPMDIDNSEDFALSLRKKLSHRFDGTIYVLHHLTGYVVSHPPGPVEHRWVRCAELPLRAARRDNERTVSRAVAELTEPGDRA